MMKYLGRTTSVAVLMLTQLGVANAHDGVRVCRDDDGDRIPCRIYRVCRDADGDRVAVALTQKAALIMGCYERRMRFQVLRFAE